MKILAKINEFFKKLIEKEEIPKIDLEVVDIEGIPEPMDVEPSPIVLKPPRPPVLALPTRFKRLLVWLNLMDVEDSIEELIRSWNKSLIVWIFNVLITGSLIYLAITPFYAVSFALIPFTIFSFGLAYYVIIEIIKEIRNIIKTGNG